MSKVLLVVCHPNYKDSFATKTVVEKLKTLIPDIEVDNIHELYPDGKIDVKAEQEKQILLFSNFLCIGLNLHISYLNG